MGVAEAGKQWKYVLYVLGVAPYIPGSGAARWRGAAGEDSQKAAFQRNRGQSHHAKAGVSCQSHA